VALALPCAATLAAEDAEDAARDCESVGACAGAQGAQPLKAALAEVAHHSEGAHGASLDWLMPKSGPASAQSLDGRRGASGAAGGAPASPWLGGRVPGSLAESLHMKRKGGAGSKDDLIAADSKDELIAAVRARALGLRDRVIALERIDPKNGDTLKVLNTLSKQALKESLKRKGQLTKDRINNMDANLTRLEVVMSDVEALFELSH